MPTYLIQCVIKQNTEKNSDKLGGTSELSKGMFNKKY